MRSKSLTQVNPPTDGGATLIAVCNASEVKPSLFSGRERLIITISQKVVVGFGLLIHGCRLYVGFGLLGCTLSDRAYLQLLRIWFLLFGGGELISGLRSVKFEGSVIIDFSFLFLAKLATTHHHRPQISCSINECLYLLDETLGGPCVGLYKRITLRRLVIDLRLG